jgi:hypothetical protein
LEKALTKRDPEKTKYFYFYKSIPVNVFSCIEIHQHRITTFLMTEGVHYLRYCFSKTFISYSQLADCFALTYNKMSV